jgi:hypothetical protein
MPPEFFMVMVMLCFTLMPIAGIIISSEMTLRDADKQIARIHARMKEEAKPPND